MKAKSQRMLVGLLMLSLACAPALAQPGRHGDRDGRDGHSVRGPDHRGGPPSHAYRPDRGPGSQAWAPGVGHYPEYRRFHNGDRLPPEYRQRQYVVNDWRAHGLRPPPRGYYWVQNGSDYLLAAIATGVISAVVVNALVGQ